MILVTGVTGRVGQATARKLLSEGHAVRGFVRDTQKLSSIAGLDGLDVACGDLADPPSIHQAMDGVSAALLVTANSEQQFTLESHLINAAQAADVRHLVKISSMEAGPEAAAPIPQLHYKAEQLIRRQTMDWTMLQPNFFMQNMLMFAQGIAAGNQFALPFGTARVAPVDCQDVGEVAAAVLTQPGHAGKTYSITGDALMNFEQIAATLSEVLGRPITYVDQAPEAFRAFLSQFVKSEWHVHAVCALFAEIKAGALEATSQDAPRILGRPLGTLTQFAQRYAKAFG